jgi:aerobic-type carbon monoxide dehydrogenase small subunit (CoxS/CutS family)
MNDPVKFYPGAQTDPGDTGGSVGILKAKASRRAFIKGVIASGAVAGSATFLFGGLGGCTSDVIIDGVSTYSCSTLTHMVGDSEVRTIEGLEGANGELHPVQQAMIDELGPQCGFCTPGQIMSAVALLEVNANPTREEARHALSGNLCRCGAYDHYLNSVMRAVQEA